VCTHQNGHSILQHVSADFAIIKQNFTQTGKLQCPSLIEKKICFQLKFFKTVTLKYSYSSLGTIMPLNVKSTLWWFNVTYHADYNIFLNQYCKVLVIYEVLYG
jgi:hypothetical protein